MSELDGLYKALRLLSMNQVEEAELECTKLLEKNAYDQAAWSLKLQCLTEAVFVDELENEEIGLAETFMDDNVISRDARPGTSLARPITTAKGASPAIRPRTNTGRPLSGVVRPETASRGGTLEQALRTSRTSKTARAITSSTARTVRLGTASMVTQPDGPFLNLARLNIEKYASDPNLSRQLFEYVFYHEGDMKVAHQIAAIATKQAEFNNWYWKNALGKCYYRLGMLREAEQQFTSSLKNYQVVETYAYLAKVYIRIDQPGKAISKYMEGLHAFPNDVTLLVGLARIQERTGYIEDSIETYRQVLKKEPNNVEATACIGTHYFYNDNPEVSLRYYRRILQMGVYSAEIYLNIGLCCFYCQQMDMAIGCIEKAHTMADDDVSADVWYNTGHIAMAIGDLVMAQRCFKLAIAASPEHAESLCNLGILRLKEGKLEEAKNLFMSAVAKGPHLFEPHYNLALLYYKNGNFADSRKYVEQALEIFPTHSYSLVLHKNIKHLYEMI